MLDFASPIMAQQRLLTTLEHLLDITATDVKGALTEASDLIAHAIGADKVDVFLLDPATTRSWLSAPATPRWGESSTGWA